MIAAMTTRAIMVTPDYDKENFTEKDYKKIKKIEKEIIKKAKKHFHHIYTDIIEKDSPILKYLRECGYTVNITQNDNPKSKHKYNIMIGW